MSTPSDKKAARREARKANLENTLAARRPDQPADESIIDEQDGAVEAVTFTAGEEPVVERAAVKPAPQTAKTPVGAANNGQPVGKTPTRPTTTTPSKPLAKSMVAAGAAASKATGAVAGASKPITRPTGNGAAYKPPTRGTAHVDDEAVKTKRDERRETRRADLARVQAERKKRIQAAKRKELAIRVTGVVLVLALVGLIGFWIYTAMQPPPKLVTGPGHYGNGITCGEETTAVHYHAHIQFVYNGNELNVPDNVGIDQANNCLYWLHVHPNDNGVVHIEAPPDAANRTFYIGDLLAVWHKTSSIQPPVGTSVDLSSTTFFGYPVDKDHPLTIYVDGKKWTGDPQAIPLTSHESIWIEYGAKIVQPTPYTFAESE